MPNDSKYSVLNSLGIDGCINDKERAFWDDYENIVGSPGSSAWGDITGTLANQTDLQAALDAKASADKSIGIVVFDSDTAVATGDGVQGIPVTSDLVGYNIVDVLCTVHDKGITGTTNVQVRRRRAGTNVDVLSTLVTIGDQFFVSDGVVNTSNDDMSEGDILYVDVDAVHSGTAPNGLSVAIQLSKA